METLGFKKTAIQQAIRALKGKDRPGLTPKRWLTHPASEAMRHLWLGRTERGFASFVLLSGVTKEGPLQRLETPKQGIHYIDKVRDISTLFKRYRALATKLIVLAYLVIFLLLLVRYGWRRGLRVFAPPCLAALAALSVVGWLGGGINLFHILALLLVLGIGIDYTIFFAESSERWQPTYLAIVLSACTTLLSFGLLALSQTPLLRAFGSVVLVGMCIACILAPIAIVERQPQQSASSHEREGEHHVQAD
jgi:predicted exporter